MYTRKRKGLSLIELLGVMAVMTILSAIVVGTYNSSRRQATESNALTAITAYRDAFTQALSLYPNISSDRYKAWVKKGSLNQSEVSMVDEFNNLVLHMNETLDDKLTLHWDSSLGCYASTGEDPWGGKYILVEYPVIYQLDENGDPIPGTEESRYEPSALNDTTGAPLVVEMCCSIWATGSSDSMLEEKTVTKDTSGIALLYKDGIITAMLNGVNKTYDLIGARIPPLDAST